MDFPTSELWNYSTQIWMLPEVETICLDLQDEYDININMLLYCCWVGDKSLSLNDDDLQSLLDALQPWQTIIKPLRDSRKMMQQHLIAMPPSMHDQTINNISEMELNAERMSQMALEKALKPAEMTPCDNSSPVDCSLNNINNYLSSLDNVSSPDKVTPQVTQLLSIIFQD